MELVKINWQEKDIKQFKEYLKTLSCSDKIERTKRIYATNKATLAIDLPKLRNIAKQIQKGNSEEFVKKLNLEFIECDILKGILISDFTDLNKLKEGLIDLTKNCDSWAVTDTIKFKIAKSNYEELFNLALEFTADPNTYTRRLGYVMFLKYVEDEKHLSQIFDVITKARNEKEYYVNMAMAWLLCEAVIKNRNLTINYLKNYAKNSPNSFVLNKTISKCSDSFRVNSEDKIALKMLKK